MQSQRGRPRRLNIVKAKHVSRESSPRRDRARSAPKSRPFKGMIRGEIVKVKRSGGYYWVALTDQEATSVAEFMLPKSTVRNCLGHERLYVGQQVEFSAWLDP